MGNLPGKIAEAELKKGCSLYPDELIKRFSTLNR